MTFELDRGSLSFDAGRRYARQGIWPDASDQSRPRYSSWALGLHYRDDIDDFGMIMLGLSSTMDRRRFAIDLTDGRWSRSEAVRAEASWLGADRWQLTAGYRIANGDSSASGYAAASNWLKVAHTRRAGLGWRSASARRDIAPHGPGRSDWKHNGSIYRRPMRWPSATGHRPTTGC
jgi:hypothetical protein